MEAIVFYLLMQCKKQFEAEDSEIYPLCLGDILKNFTFNNMKKKKNRIKGKCDFAIDYNDIDTSNILDIQ